MKSFCQVLAALKVRIGSHQLAAASAAKSLQSCPTLCDPIDGSPPGSPVPGILQARTLEWAAISFSNAWKWKGSHSVVSDSSQPHGLQPTRLLRPWDFPNEYWSGVPLPSLPPTWLLSKISLGWTWQLGNFYQENLNFLMLGFQKCISPYLPCHDSFSYSPNLRNYSSNE